MDDIDKRTLIVNYIPNSLSDVEVRHLFSQIGEVSSCKLVRNKLTGESLGYAFVVYESEYDAENAITKMTGYQLQDKRLKVALAKKENSADAGVGGVGVGVGGDTKNTNVYIANLPQSVTESALFEMFSVHGSIQSHKIMTSANGTSKGAGFVKFDTETEARSAIAELNGQMLPESTTPITVKMAIPPAEVNRLRTPVNTLSNTTVLAAARNNNSLNRYNPMLPHHQTGAVIPTNTSFGATSSVGAALSSMPSHIAQYGNKNTFTAQGVGGGVVNGGTVYVFGLQASHTELTLYQLFSPFGGIANVRLIRDIEKEDQPCKGYGFVNYIDMDDALKAIATMNGAKMEDRVLQVSLKQNKKQAPIAGMQQQYQQFAQ